MKRENLKHSNRQIAQIMKAYYDSLVNDLLPENFWETNQHTCNHSVKNELFDTYEIHNSNFPMMVGVLFGEA